MENAITGRPDPNSPMWVSGNDLAKVPSGRSRRRGPLAPKDSNQAAGPALPHPLKPVKSSMVQPLDAGFPDYASPHLQTPTHQRLSSQPPSRPHKIHSTFTVYKDVHSNGLDEFDNSPQYGSPNPAWMQLGPDTPQYAENFRRMFGVVQEATTGPQQRLETYETHEVLMESERTEMTGEVRSLSHYIKTVLSKYPYVGKIPLIP